jgi:hypothetical protein
MRPNHGKAFYDASGHRVRYSPCKARSHDGEEVLGSEVWQFLIILLGFLIVAVLWLFVVYLPGRTLERWEDRRSGRGESGPSKPS